MKLLLAKINTMKISRIWIIFFIYSSIVSLTIQFIVLPLIFPSLNRGFGVMDGGDWVVYHYWSEFYAQKIFENSWSYWSLRPQGFGLVGVTSAIYAFTGISKPFILIPLYSSLHALGSICIVLLMQKLGVKRSVAFFSALPYLIFPSSILWVSQVLKDVFTLNATLFMLYGVVCLFGVVKVNSIKAGIKSHLFSVILIYMSFLIVLVIRPYMVELNYLYLILLLIIFSVWLVYKLAKRKIKLVMVITSIFIQLSLLYLISIMDLGFSDVTPKMNSINYSGYIAEAEEQNRMNIIKLQALDEAGLLREGINRYWKNDDINDEKSKSLLSQVDKFYAERASREMLKEIKAEMIHKEKINALKKLITLRLLENKEKLAQEVSTIEKLKEELTLLENTIPSEVSYQKKIEDELSILEVMIPTEVSNQKKIEDELTLFIEQITSGKVSQEMIDEIKNLAEINKIQNNPDYIKKDITRAEVDGDFLPEVITESEAKSIAYSEAIEFNPYVQNTMAQLFEKYNSLEWQEVAFIPSFIDRKFKQIYDQRNYFYLFQSSANTTFDYDVDLNSTIKMLGYIPRALQVAYLAPFPSTFFEDRAKSFRAFKAKIMKNVVHIEMLFIYVSLLGLVFAIYLWRRKVEFWVMISFSLFFTVFPIYAYPNIGALVRYRYAGIMLITAICLCALVSVYLNYKNKKL